MAEEDNKAEEAQQMEGQQPEQQRPQPEQQGEQEQQEEQGQQMAQETGASGEVISSGEETQVAEEQVPTEVSKGGSKKFLVLSLLAVVLVVGIVAAGFWFGRRAREVREEEMVVRPTPTVEVDEMTVQYGEQSSSDEIADIEKDLNATSFEGIDKELPSIDQELNAQD